MINLRNSIVAFIILLAGLTVLSARRTREPREVLPKSADLSKRVYNVVDINKLGQYVCNMGQFYSSWNELTPTGEWPLGSGREQMYRMNLFVSVPGNVVQSRAYGEKEWDPVGGYYNEAISMLPVSNDTSTWPLDGNGNPYWPVRDSEDNDHIVSHQDTYGIYSDSTNYKGQADPADYLRIEVRQTTYAWNTALDEDYIILKFDVLNRGDRTFDSLYLSMYCDFDIGGYESGGEYTDDRLELDRERQFFYFYDSDAYSNQWQEECTPMGLVLLETPEKDGVRPGLTDWHYTSNFDEPTRITEDSTLFRYISSSPILKADTANWGNLFHGEDIHFDDPSLIPDTGAVLVAIASSGPYPMEPGDSLTFIFALVAGNDHEDITATADRIWDVYHNNWVVKSIDAPQVTSSVGDGKCLLSWDNKIDREYIDVETGRNNFQGYYIYKTEDPNRISWTLYDSIPSRFDAGDFHDQNAYEYTDNNVLNGFYYSYSVTAYDSSGYESGKAILEDSVNTVELRPTTEAAQSSDKVTVVPNPYVISAKWERERLGNISDGEPVRELSFRNLPGTCTIKIYTLDGDLVKTINHNNGTGTEYWDIRSTYNQLIATGVYFYRVSSGQGEKTGKFAVIR